MLDAALLDRWNREVKDEISRHKRVESQKAGRDIGFEKAAFDWLEKYYDSWCRSRDYLKPHLP
jgi:hypothetical protein